jgi:hypothetical protein
MSGWSMDCIQICFSLTRRRRAGQRKEDSEVELTRFGGPWSVPSTWEGRGPCETVVDFLVLSGGPGSEGEGDQHVPPTHGMIAALQR